MKYSLVLIAVGLFSTDSIFAQEAGNIVAPVNYHTNLSIFTALFVVLLLLLVAILTMVTNIRTLVDSEVLQPYLKKKNKGNNSGKIISSLALLGFLMFSQNSWALTFHWKGNQAEHLPWIQVENADLWWITLLNVFLVVVLIQLKVTLNILLRKTQPEEVTKKSASRESLFRLNRLLTDAVPVEEEESIILDHEFDGIRELDNNLPPWWVAMFWGSIVFAFVYIGHYHIFKTGDLQIAEYNKSMERAEVEVQAYLAKMAMNVDETNAVVLTDASDLSAGRAIYETNCTVCHKEKGEGDIGPNLTDDYWLYSNDIKEIFKVIKKGTSKGMPEHGSKLNPIQIQQVASYVWSMPYAEGKEPEGEKMTK